MNKEKIKNIVFVLLGVAGLLFKKSYNGPMSEIVISYFGNVSASFAAYFWIKLIPFKSKMNRLYIFIIALALAELFELTNGFYIMSNTYDPLDLLANILGVGLALVVDIVIDKTLKK